MIIIFKKNMENNMRKFTIFGFIILGLLTVWVHADEPIGVFANMNTGSIQLIDPLTNTASQSILKGEMGTYEGRHLDVVITSDGKTAIVSNFGDFKLFFIDISGGFNAQPTLLGSTRIPIEAEDMVITPDDKYVLVSDGFWGTHIITVEIATRRLAYVKELPWLYEEAQAIAIAQDGKTVLAADYWGGFIHTFTLDGNGKLKYKRTVDVLPSWPTNIAISPDGKTVIAVCAFRSSTPVLSFNSEGNLVLKEFIALPARRGQSCVFSSDGTKAYYLSNSQSNGTRVHVLNVTGPGMVSASGVSIPIFPRRGVGHFFGVDTIALDPSETYLYVTNPTSSDPIAGVAVIDLAAQTKIMGIPANGFPAGIAFAAIKQE
jgi:DNA-binding beta-propeller fold protein YncE